MKEETKEEYLERLRKERNEKSIFDDQPYNVEEDKPRTVLDKLKTAFFLLLLLLFVWAIFSIFGMLKSN